MHISEIITNLKNRYDYAEYVSFCKENNIPRTLNFNMFADRVVTIDYAESFFPNQPIKEAFMSQIASNNNTLGEPFGITNIAYLTKPAITGSCCGGGSVK